LNYHRFLLRLRTNVRDLDRLTCGEPVAHGPSERAHVQSLQRPRALPNARIPTLTILHDFNPKTESAVSKIFAGFIAQQLFLNAAAQSLLN